MSNLQKEYMTSYGKRNTSGKTCTFQQLNQQSFMEKIISISLKIIIVLLVLLCFYYIYKIDVKQDSKDVIQATKKLSSISFDKLYNDTVQVSHAIKTTITQHIEVATENLKQMDEQYNITYKIQDFFKGIGQLFTSENQRQLNVGNQTNDQDFENFNIVPNFAVDSPSNQTALPQTQYQPYYQMSDL